MGEKARCIKCGKWHSPHASGECKNCRRKPCKSCGRMVTPFIRRNTTHFACSYCKALRPVASRDPNMLGAF